MSTVEEREIGEAAVALLVELARRGLGGVEVFEKRGRSRTFERGADRESVLMASEAGWAARAGDARRSLFVAATGTPDPALLLPDPGPQPLLLPEPAAAAPWTEPEDLAAPLATEGEAAALFDGVGERLARELPGAALVAARLDDGASESALASTRGVRARQRTRAAWLRIEAQRGGRKIELALAGREARAFPPGAIARRLADRLSALESPGAAAATKVRRAIVAAPLAARLVEAMAPLFVGRAARERLAPLLAGDDRLAAEAFSLADDGRLDGGLLSAAADGEGVPTRRVTLVEAGRFRAPLLAWWEGAGESSGCARRASWRDLPRRAPTHLFALAGEVAPRDLMSSLGDSAYLIDAEGAVELDAATGRFTVPVSGFRIDGGRSVAPLGACRLTGSLSSLLRQVRAVARDLTFVPGDGLFGAPTMALEAARGEDPSALLELVPAPLR